MKLSVVSPDTVDWPVHIPVPQNGGTVKRHKMTASFRLLDIEELRQRVGGDADLFGRVLSSDADGVFLRDVLVGWRGVEDEDGNEAPFTDENRDALLRSVAARTALTEAFVQMLQGRQAKN